MARKNKNEQVTAPFIMMGTKKGAVKRGAQKVAQSDFLTIDGFTTFIFNPTEKQIKAKLPMCSLRMVMHGRTIAVLNSRYVNIKELKRYLRDAEKLSKKEVKAKK